MKNCILHKLNYLDVCKSCGLPVGELHARGLTYSGHDPIVADRIGIRTPGDIGDIFEVVAEPVEDDGMMIYELSTSNYYDSVIVGAYHDGVGLVTYFRLDSIDDAYQWIAERD